MYNFFKDLEEMDKIHYTDYLLRGVNVGLFEETEDDIEPEEEYLVDWDEDDYGDFDDMFDEDDDNGIFFDEEYEEEVAGNKEQDFLLPDIDSEMREVSKTYNVIKSYVDTGSSIEIQLTSSSINDIKKFIHDTFFIRGYIIKVIDREPPEWAKKYFITIKTIGSTFQEVSYN